jgi:hypothetical protein
MNFGGATYLRNEEVWNSLAPQKCKIFAWLILHNRLNTRDRLSRRGVIEDALAHLGAGRRKVSHTSCFYALIPHSFGLIFAGKMALAYSLYRTP